MRPSCTALLALAGLAWFEASAEELDLSSAGLSAAEDACAGEAEGECALSFRQLRGKRELLLSREARVAAAASKPRLMKGVSYGPVPLRSPRGGSKLHEDDWMAPAAKPMWGAAGRWDLGLIAALGANFVRLYGNDPNNDHSEFLDEALRNGLQVAPGMSDYPYYQMKGSCRTTGYDCYSQVKDLYIQNLRSGFLTKDRTYHPALAYFSIVNEPDLKMPPTATNGGYAGVARMCKAIVSAFDAVLDAEREVGVQGAGINFTATFSFAVCSSCSWFKRNPALGQMTQLEDAMLNPLKYGYTPRNDIPRAFKTRWTNSFNTQNKAQDLPHMLLDAYDRSFKGTPVYIAEYHSTYVNETSDLARILSIAERSHLFLGISYFEFQVAYWKGGTEEAFGMFGLGDYTVAQMPYYGETYKIDCLTPVFSKRAGTTQTAALATAYGGKYFDPKTLCQPNAMSVPISGEGYGAIAKQGSQESMASFTTRVVNHLGGIVVSQDGLDEFSKQYVGGAPDAFGSMVEGIVAQPDWTRFKAGARCIADRHAFPDAVAGAIGYACQNETRFNCSKLQVPAACAGTYDSGDLFFSHFYLSQPDADPLEACAFGGAAVYASPELYTAVRPECVAEPSGFKALSAGPGSGRPVKQVRPVHTLGVAPVLPKIEAEPLEGPQPEGGPAGAEQGAAPSCALYGCVGYAAGHRCQCNSGCEEHGSCCGDYAAKCRPSCAVYGCGAGFAAAQHCQCNPTCVLHGNCCGDYLGHCAR